MDRFTVVWLERAEQQLIAIWLDADDRQAVTTATAWIDSALTIGARNEGEEVAEGLMRFTVPPLEVLFSVREDDRIVEVARIRRLSS